MTDEEYLRLKESGIYTKESKMLLALHDMYLNYLYISSIESIEAEKQRLREIFNRKA